MKINYKILMSWTLVILWMSTIFYLSSMNSEVSNVKSKDTINTVVKNTIGVTNNISDKNVSKENINIIVNALHNPLRKFMHSIVYFVLVILLINAFYNTNIRGYKGYLLSIIISFIYACTDEYHQLYVPGRTSQFIDILIDTVGTLIGSILFYIYCKIIKKNKICNYK